jgi:CHAT domain-containing protein
VTGGDEVIGFTRTFLSAGASNLVVSLWDVEDKSTAALMEQFYQQMQKSDLPSAMQQAQVALLKDEQTRHPFFWAGFNLVGTL